MIILLVLKSDTFYSVNTDLCKSNKAKRQNIEEGIAGILFPRYVGFDSAKSRGGISLGHLKEEMLCS